MDEIRLLPKAELHVHLEGTIRPETLLALFQRHGNREYSTLDEVQTLYRHRDFLDFLEHFKYIHSWIRNEHDLEAITCAFLVDLARQNVTYVEATFAPSGLVYYNGLDCDRALDAIQRGYARARTRHQIEMGLLVDLIRDMGVDNGWKMARWAARNRERGVVGIALGGNERKYPAAPFAPVFQWARAEGLVTTAHAGETEGAWSVWDCARLLQVHRVGHGVSMMDDPHLVEYCIEHGVAVEVCLTSNVVTGAVASLEAHPLRRMVDAGLRVSINTDDPPLFGTTLEGELAIARDVHSLTGAELEGLMQDAGGALRRMFES